MYCFISRLFRIAPKGIEFSSKVILKTKNATIKKYLAVQKKLKI